MANYGYYNDNRVILESNPDSWLNSGDRDSFNRYAGQTLLDSSRDWKTKFYSDDGFTHNLFEGLNMSEDGRYFTGESRFAEGTGGSNKKGRRKTKWQQKFHEILDFDAYGRDAVYASALDARHGKRNFSTLQDIYDAEEVMSGTWQKAPPEPEVIAEPEPVAPATPPPPPVEPQKIDLSKYISQDQLAQYQSEWQTQAQDQYQADFSAAQQQWAADSAAALQQAQTSWSDQYASSLQQAKSDWSSEFLSAEQQWAETAAKEQQDIRSSLLDDFKTQTAAKDRVYETQIDELKGMYAEQESDWKDQANLYEQVLADQKTSWDTQIKDQSNLYAQQQAQQQAGWDEQQAQQQAGWDEQQAQQQAGWDEQAGVYESTIGSQQSALDDFKTQLSDSSSTIKGQQATIGEIEAQRAHQAGQIKAYQEQDIRDAERARIAATYGQSGKPMNQAVKGVRTQNELPQSKPKFSSSFFGRSGSRIKNTSLNIA